MSDLLIPASLREAITALMERDQASVFALADIAQERLRQIEHEGWTVGNDDKLESGEMAAAAACYSVGQTVYDLEDVDGMTIVKPLWPWSRSWWKPRSKHRNRVRAGALLVAELARHLRAATRDDMNKTVAILHTRFGSLDFDGGE